MNQGEGDICNLYAQSRTRLAVMMKFGLKENRTSWFEPKFSIFPGNTAPVIRLGDGGEPELLEMTWGFVRRPHGKAPERTGNCRDDTIRTNLFWVPSFRERRCLVPFSSYCEPLGKRPADWVWHSLRSETEERPLGAFAGIWRSYTGPVKKDGDVITENVFAFMTCGPNTLETAVAHERMPVLLDKEEQFETWLRGTEDEAHALANPYPAEGIRIVQRGSSRKDPLEVAED